MEENKELQEYVIDLGAHSRGEVNESYLRMFGGAIKGNRIDVWFPSHREALKFGVQKIVVQRVRNG